MKTRSEDFIVIFEGFKLGSLGITTKVTGQLKEKTPEQIEKERVKDEKEKAKKEKDIINAIFSSRQDRKSHPDGKFDNAKRWYPSDREKCDCCGNVRGPSRTFPFSYMVHCRTKKHIEELVKKLGMDDPSIKKEAGIPT
jgi:hypothetical protein